MNIYRKTQRGTVILGALIAGMAGMTIGGITLRPLLLGVPILGLVSWLFHSLTIEIRDGELRWQFGPGLIRKRVPLDQILSAEPVRTNIVEGWGIHLSRYGWLYNVSGFDAVAVRMKDGRRFALGTDEPADLASRLRAVIIPPA